MVRAYFPQKATKNISANTNNPPQGEILQVDVVEGGWIDDLGNQFIDDTGAEFEFGGPV